AQGAAGRDRAAAGRGDYGRARPRERLARGLGCGAAASLAPRRHEMAVGIVRLGEARQPGEGLRVGTGRRPPRGVRKQDFARRDYFDVWLPELAPSEPLRAWAPSQPFTPHPFAAYPRTHPAPLTRPTP